LKLLLECCSIELKDSALTGKLIGTMQNKGFRPTLTFTIETLRQNLSKPLVYPKSCHHAISLNHSNKLYECDCNEFQLKVLLKAV
jgi:hypothetical protein